MCEHVSPSLRECNTSCDTVALVIVAGVSILCIHEQPEHTYGLTQRLAAIFQACNRGGELSTQTSRTGLCLGTLSPVELCNRELSVHSQQPGWAEDKAARPERCRTQSEAS
jgi:hypothetical protein